MKHFALWDIIYIGSLKARIAGRISMKAYSHIKYKAVLVLFFLVFCLAAIPAQAQQNQPFNWSLALQNVRSGDLVPISGQIQSWTGEQFRLQIIPASSCYAYVVYESPGGDDVMILHAGLIKGGETWYSQVLELALPSGAESFFVITSREEQKTLAQRITAFSANSGSLQKRALMNEIYRLRRDISQFKEAPEKPVLMGGASRGSPDKNQGVEFSGLDTYVKTISIEH